MSQQVDILLPAFNEEKRIASTIESIQKSTHTNWRLLIIDDCSTDKTRELVSSYIKEDSRIVLIENEENMHIAMSLNNGLKHCINEYVFRIDAGDLFYPDRIEKQLKFMIENNLDLSSGNVEIFNDSGKVLYRSNSYVPSNKIFKIAGLINIFTHSTYCFRLKTAIAIGQYRNLVPAEDYDFVCRFLLASYKVAVMEDVLVLYHAYEGGISSLNSSLQGALALQIAKNFRKRKTVSLEILQSLKQEQKTMSKLKKKIIHFNFKINRILATLIVGHRLGSWIK
jgi:glycosyltransferase involved in cell wall biosynthesis